MAAKKRQRRFRDATPLWNLMHGRPLLIKNPTPPRHPQRVTGIDVGQGNAVTLQKSTPTQLTLMADLSSRRSEKAEDYSNTVELYDAVPKYFASKKRMAEQRKDGRFLNSLKQTFRHKGQGLCRQDHPGAH